MNLVIVESPTKAKTIEKFLGNGYSVVSSYGHVRDLPRGAIGVDIEHDFEPKYVIPRKIQKKVTELKKLAAKAETVILASDEDREGEAIAWHLTQALGLNELKNQNSKLKDVKRIVFHEITKSAIEQALKNPRQIRMPLVYAQQARRVLDRLVGYTLSPFLWKKILRGLSAGRVQSVALRLIVERENEIRAFKPEEYFTIHAIFSDEEKKPFAAELTKIDNEPVPKPGIKTNTEAKRIAADIRSSICTVAAIEKKETKKNPLPPFTTSTLQQESYKRLRFTAKNTMRIAQKLYEEGYITYMRTDSVNLSAESLAAAEKLIREKFGAKYATDAPRAFKKKSRLAQEAHEAIRPTDPFRLPQAFGGGKFFDKNDEKKLYELIWRRFVASQMPQARFESGTVQIEARNRKTYTLRTTGSVLRFDGFLKVWPQKFEDRRIPILSEGKTIIPEKVENERHETEPPPRYNDASLVKTLETHGIGRPSTYAPIISVIQTRNYVEKNEARRFQPTEIGELVNKILTEHFPEIVDINFTAHFEEELDKIAEEKKEWRNVIREFYEPFSKNLEEKYESVKKIAFAEKKTDEVCEKCGKPMAIKTGRFGKFLACTGFPDCKNTKSYHDESNSFGACPKCEKGMVIKKRTRNSRFFYGCSRYPDCDYASWKNPNSMASA